MCALTLDSRDNSRNMSCFSINKQNLDFREDLDRKQARKESMLHHQINKKCYRR
jgi:hypothetical protein